MSDQMEDIEVGAISALIAALKPLDPNARARVVDFVLKRFAIPRHGIEVDSEGSTELLSGRGAMTSHSGAIDIRTFAAEKTPKTVNEKVALIAYYLQPAPLLFFYAVLEVMIIPVAWWVYARPDTSSSR